MSDLVNIVTNSTRFKPRFRHYEIFFTDYIYDYDTVDGLKRKKFHCENSKCYLKEQKKTFLAKLIFAGFYLKKSFGNLHGIKSKTIIPGGNMVKRRN